MIKWVRTFLLVTAVVALGRPAAASTIGFAFNKQFSNNVIPGDPNGPWAGALFNDAPVGGLTAGYDVRLTIFTNGPSSGLTGTEFLTETDFNISNLTALNQGQFRSILVSGTNGALGAVGSTTSATFGFDFEQADGDGIYDMRLNFSTNPPRATTGNVYVLDIDWQGGALLAGNFNQIATVGGGNGPFFAATHIQGIGSQSTWAGADRPPCINCATPFEVNEVAMPEPASMVMLGTGLVAVAFAVRRRRSS